MDLSTIYIAISDGKKHLTVDGHLVLFGRLLAVFSQLVRDENLEQDQPTTDGTSSTDTTDCEE